VQQRRRLGQGGDGGGSEEVFGVVGDGDEASDAAANHACDGHSLAAAFALVAVDLGVADDTEDECEDGEDQGESRGYCDDSQDKRGDAETVACTGGFDGGSFHGEGHAAGLAVVGGDGALALAAGADDRLSAVGEAEDLGSAVAGGGVGVDGVGVLRDDLSGAWVDEAAIAVEDGDGDVLAAGWALAFLGGHGFSRFETG